MNKLAQWIILSLFVVPLVGCNTTSINTANQPQVTKTTNVNSSNSRGISFPQLVTKYRKWKEKGKRIRAALCELPGIDRVYAIDDYHSYVILQKHAVTAFVTGNAYKHLLALAKAYGGALTIRHRYLDTLTNQTKVETIPIEIYDNPNSHDIYFLDPLSHGKKSFNFAEETFHWEGGEMDVFSTITYILPTDTQWHLKRLAGIFLTHPVPQPFVYKSEDLPPPEQIIRLPAQGDLEKVEPIFVNAASPIHALKNFLKGWVKSDTSYGPYDVLQYLTALCRNNDGRCLWVINRAVPNPKLVRDLNGHFGVIPKFGKLMEVSPVEAWQYVIAPPRNVVPTCYMACLGPKKFALKAYRKTVTGRRTSYSYWVYNFYPHRDLSGISFECSTVATRHASHYNVSGNQNISFSTSVSPIITNLARNTAITKSPITKLLGTTRYQSTYNGIDESGCVLVSVIYDSDVTPHPIPQETKTIYNFRFCNNQLQDTGITPPQVIRDDVLRSLPQIARGCQQYGESKTSIDNYDIYCRPLRGESQCEVQISILKENQLIEKYLFDGCTGKRIP